MRRATAPQPLNTLQSFNFYPRSPCGERQMAGVGRSAQADFYPRSPCGERQMTLQALFPPHYFYPRSPCGERLKYARFNDDFSVISIHALLAESDHHNRSTRCKVSISIHALLAESDRHINNSFITICNFYPRSPCGERLYGFTNLNVAKYFYPRSPCGERLASDISILSR